MGTPETSRDQQAQGRGDGDDVDVEASDLRQPGTSPDEDDVSETGPKGDYDATQDALLYEERLGEN